MKHPTCQQLWSDFTSSGRAMRDRIYEKQMNSAERPYQSWVMLAARRATAATAVIATYFVTSTGGVGSLNFAVTSSSVMPNSRSMLSIIGLPLFGGGFLILPPSLSNAGGLR